LPYRPRCPLDRGRGRLRESLRELLLRGTRAERAGAGDSRRRHGRLPGAGFCDPARRRLRLRGPRSAPVKLDRGRTALAVIDVQEAFRPAVLDFDAVVANVATLVQGARILGLPVLVTEQYPKGLGGTVPEV